MKQNYTINLLVRRSNSVEPCQGCKHQYQCGLDEMACENFKFFVETGRTHKTASCTPSHAIYIDIFHTEPKMIPKKETT